MAETDPQKLKMPKSRPRPIPRLRNVLNRDRVRDRDQESDPRPRLLDRDRESRQCLADCFIKKVPKATQVKIEHVRSVLGDLTPVDEATALKVYDVLRRCPGLPATVKYTEKTRAGKLVWDTKISPTGTFAGYESIPVLSEHQHIGRAARVYLFYTPDGEYVIVLLHKKKNCELPKHEDDAESAEAETVNVSELLERQKRETRNVSNAVLMTVTNPGIRRRCRVHLTHNCKGNVMPVPHAFDDLADRAGLDANKVWFTTMVLSPDMFDEYIAVVDGNIAAL